MDGIICYSPRWDEACSDCMFRTDEGCKLTASPNVGMRDGFVVCEDYVKRESEGTGDE